MIYRNRQQGGLKLLDEEMPTWADCLHRYDQYSQAHANMRGGDALIAAINKLYTYKTINYSTKNKMKKQVMFIDKEVLPPDYWNSARSSEYLRVIHSLFIP